MAAIKKISTLPPLLGIQAPAGSYVPIIIPSSSSTTGFTTVRATILQSANSIKPFITNQPLSTTSDVIFNSITSINSISSVNVSAINFYGDGSHITNVFNQTLNTADDVRFNSISSNSLSCVSIFAAKLTSNNRDVVTKYSETINHTGNSTPTLYTINHPFTSEDVMMQLLERRPQPGGLVNLELVLASMVNITNGINSLVAVTINNINDATYKIVITG